MSPSGTSYLVVSSRDNIFCEVNKKGKKWVNKKRVTVDSSSLLARINDARRFCSRPVNQPSKAGYADD